MVRIMIRIEIPGYLVKSETYFCICVCVCVYLCVCVCVLFVTMVEMSGKVYLSSVSEGTDQQGRVSIIILLS